MENRLAVRVGAVALSFLAVAGCGGTGMDRAGVGQGQVQFVVSSNASAASPLDRTAMMVGSVGSCQGVQAATVTFSSVLARTLDGTLVDVAIALPTTVDLLSLVNGKQATLPDGFLAPGTYDQFVVVMKAVELTLASGTKIAVTPPGGGWTAIVPVAAPFTVAAGTTTTVELVFRRDLSFRCSLGDWEFQPQFDCQGKPKRTQGDRDD